MSKLWILPRLNKVVNRLDLLFFLFLSSFLLFFFYGVCLFVCSLFVFHLSCCCFRFSFICFALFLIFLFVSFFFAWFLLLLFSLRFSLTFLFCIMFTFGFVYLFFSLTGHFKQPFFMFIIFTFETSSLLAITADHIFATSLTNIYCFNLSLKKMS